MEREWTDRSRSRSRSNIGSSSNENGGSSDHDSVTAILIVTRNSEVVVSTSDEATGVLTWLLRTCPTAHSDCSKLGDEKYVTGKYPSWRIITTEHGPPRSRSVLTHGKTAREPDTDERFRFLAAVTRATIRFYVCCATICREIWRPDEKHARISRREANGGYATPLTFVHICSVNQRSRSQRCVRSREILVFPHAAIRRSPPPQVPRVFIVLPYYF